MPLDASVMAAVDTDSRSQRVEERCGSRWGVVHTHPQAERWAAQNLQRQGYAAYLPTHTVRIRDRTLPTLTRPVERPLFTSYLFVAVPLTLWGPIRHTLGVRSLLMSGEKPYLLPDAVWNALQAGEALRRTPTTPGSLWRPGAPCQPRDGPFQGLPAVVIEVERQIAKVAIVMFGELRQVSVDVNSLVARE
jgi:transcription antitermination factor NusG